MPGFINNIYKGGNQYIQLSQPECKARNGTASVLLLADSFEYHKQKSIPTLSCINPIDFDFQESDFLPTSPYNYGI